MIASTRRRIAIGGAAGVLAVTGLVAAASPTVGQPPANALNILWADYCGRVADPACSPSPSATTATVAPSASVGPTARPSGSTAPSATPTPTLAPTPTPTVAPTPPPAAGGYILVSAQQLLSRSTSGAAWQGVLDWANRTPDVDLSNLDSSGDVITLAKGLVYARTGDGSYRTGVIAALGKAQQSGVSRALELARGVGAYVMAADLVGYHDPGFMAWAKAQRTRPVSGGPATMDACAAQRPNNWGNWCRSSRLIIDLYVGDTNDVATSVKLFAGWLGDRSQYAGYSYGDTTWQADPSKPVGINPVGATKSGHSIDGVLPDDQRRAGSFSWPPPCENYVSEALQGATLEATVLTRAGYPAWQWSDQALRRAVDFKYANGCPFIGDDSDVPFVTDAAYGQHNAGSAPSQPGKGGGYGDWWAVP